MILRAERERKRERERRVRGVFILHGWKLVSGSKRDRGESRAQSNQTWMDPMVHPPKWYTIHTHHMMLSQHNIYSVFNTGASFILGQDVESRVLIELM